jgi:hypothetical protein
MWTGRSDDCPFVDTPSRQPFVKLNELLNIRVSAGFGISGAARNTGDNHRRTQNRYKSTKLQKGQEYL